MRKIVEEITEFAKINKNNFFYIKLSARGHATGYQTSVNLQQSLSKLEQ